MAAYALQQTACYRQIMQEESLGDEKPSQLLQWMQRLVGDDQVELAFFKEMFFGEVALCHPNCAGCIA